MLKKAVFWVCGSILILCIYLGIMAIHNATTATSGIADKTGNVNVMLTRPENWSKLVDAPVIREEDMALVDGSTATIPVTAELLRQFYDYRDYQVDKSGYVCHSTTHTAYEKLIVDKSKSLIFVTPPSDEESGLAKDQGVEMEVTPIARDGFVFITHRDNPVESLTVEQIQKIYTGEITNWKEVGGQDLAIRAYQREKNSGSQTAMEQLVMKGMPLMDPIETKAMPYMSMGALVDAVAEYENGPASIGYSYYYYLNNLYKNENIKVLKIEGITPENENLISGAYPFATCYYAVIRSDEPQDSSARILRDWLVSREGQQVIRLAGYCTVSN